MDLQTIQSRLRTGIDSDSLHRFFLDLLLLFTNAIVFFLKNSPEHVAALELRSLVRKNMNDMLQITQPVPITIEPKEEPDSLSQPTKSSPLVACGQRSSSKAPSDMSKRKLSDEKKRETEEKPKVDHKITKKNKNGGVRNHAYGGNELSSHDGLEVKTVKKESSMKKKQGAVSFLKRIKQNPPSKGVDDENGDFSEDKSEKEEEGKKRGSEGKEREWRRSERVTRSCNGERGGREESGRMRRGVGRPPKRPEHLRKRGRENSYDGAGRSGGRARKRSRRR